MKKSTMRANVASEYLLNGVHCDKLEIGHSNSRIRLNSPVQRSSSSCSKWTYVSCHLCCNKAYAQGTAWADSVYCRL